MVQHTYTHTMIKEIKRKYKARMIGDKDEYRERTGEELHFHQKRRNEGKSGSTVIDGKFA